MEVKQLQHVCSANHLNNCQHMMRVTAKQKCAAVHQQCIAHTCCGRAQPHMRRRRRRQRRLQGAPCAARAGRRRCRLWAAPAPPPPPPGGWTAGRRGTAPSPAPAAWADCAQMEGRIPSQHPAASQYSARLEPVCQGADCQTVHSFYKHARAGMPACCSSRGALRCRFLLLPGRHRLAGVILSILKLVGEELPCQRVLLALCMWLPCLAAVSVAGAHAGVSCGGEMLCSRRCRHAAAWLPAQAWKLLLSLKMT